VDGVDGLKVGGGCGGGGAGYGVCACPIVTLKKATHPATKNLANAIRSNLVVCIAVSFEPIYYWPSAFGLTTRPSTLRFRPEVTNVEHRPRQFAPGQDDRYRPRASLSAAQRFGRQNRSKADIARTLQIGRL
jgi:hypothetical protein